MTRSLVWILSELYYPEKTSTGHVMTTIAEGMAKTHDVRVLCAQPSYSAKGLRAPKIETRNGVMIRRIRSTSLGKTRLLYRAVDALTVSLSSFRSLVTAVGPGDDVLVVTNPPTLPYLALIAGKLRGFRVSVIIHDIFPEVLEVGGSGSLIQRLAMRILHGASRWAYRSAESLIVIGPDQAARIEKKMGRSVAAKIKCIPLAYDDGFHQAIPRHQSTVLDRLPAETHEKCLFQFAGNIGPLQGIEFLSMAIGEDRNSGAHFCFVGSGRSLGALEAASLANATILPAVDREDAPDLHAGCDVALVSLVEGMWGVSVPSRIGNALASGRPILAVADKGSTLDRLIEEFDVGWSVRPGDIDSFWEAVNIAVSNPHERLEKGGRARQLAEDEYQLGAMQSQYAQLFSNTSAQEPS